MENGYHFRIFIFTKTKLKEQVGQPILTSPLLVCSEGKAFFLLRSFRTTTSSTSTRFFVCVIYAYQCFLFGITYVPPLCRQTISQLEFLNVEFSQLIFFMVLLSSLNCFNVVWLDGLLSRFACVGASCDVLKNSRTLNDAHCTLFFLGGV